MSVCPWKLGSLFTQEVNVTGVLTFILSPNLPTFILGPGGFAGNHEGGKRLLTPPVCKGKGNLLFKRMRRSLFRWVQDKLPRKCEVTMSVPVRVLLVGVSQLGLFCLVFKDVKFLSATLTEAAALAAIRTRG